ncbi:phosphate ABC transporter substrate-binding protein PstS [Apibacter raozihei]|uniref:phosphate ABC transporter substrate-binding protein PstS n=1 Tax=Apibacter TaxID=1778601 RepID=UPI000FE40FC0|nr:MULTISPECIES: phosphate ABC transporter substrate-binding protein PstS [Apibacter]
MKKIILLLSGAVMMLTACNQDKEGKAKLSGAGATFPAPFYNIVFKNYSEQSGNEVTYGATGSGSGIRSLKDRTVDFGATDVFLSDDELKEMGGEIVHIPTALGAVVLSYNLPDVKGLKLTAELISEIYRGKIKNWNDPKIKAINSEITFPDLAITPVYRSDGSGTTYVFTDYMSKADELWNKEIGKGKSLEFPAGIAAKGNPGVAGIISKTKGSIGYIGSEYALALNIPSASLKNSSGKFVEATTESISASANVDLPADTRVMITNSSSADAYPISTFTWIILFKEQSYNNRTENTAKALVGLLDYVIGEEGQKVAAKTHYAPLPQKAVELNKTNIKSITFNKKAINP